MLWEEEGFTLYLPRGEASEEMPARYFVRLPQENQPAETLTEHLHDVEMLLAEAREFWRNWKPFGNTNWSFPDRHGEFLTACANTRSSSREIVRSAFFVKNASVLNSAKVWGYQDYPF